jgi:hypothetical protein
MTKRQVQDAVYCIPRAKIENNIRAAVLPPPGNRGAFLTVYEGVLIRNHFDFGDLEGKVKSRLTSILN